MRGVVIRVEVAGNDVASASIGAVVSDEEAGASFDVVDGDGVAADVPLMTTSGLGWQWK